MKKIRLNNFYMKKILKIMIINKALINQNKMNLLIIYLESFLPRKRFQILKNQSNKYRKEKKMKSQQKLKKIVKSIKKLLKNIFNCSQFYYTNYYGVFKFGNNIYKAYFVDS